MTQPVTPSQTEPPVMLNAPVVVFFLLLLDSLHFVFALLLRNENLHPSNSAFWVLGLATVETAVFLIARRQARLSVLRQHLGFFITVGILVATATNLSYYSVTFIDPGTAALLSKSDVIFLLALSFLWLGERFAPLQWVGALLALIGVFIISFQPGDFFRLGSLVVLGAAFCYSMHTAVVKRFGGNIDFPNFFLFRVASTSLFLFLIALSWGQLALPPTGRAWGMLLLAGTLDVVISRILYYWALRRLNMSVHSIILTLSPVVAIGWTLLLFAVWPTAQGLIGGTAVILGVILVTVYSRSAKKKMTSG